MNKQTNHKDNKQKLYFGSYDKKNTTVQTIEVGKIF